MPAPVLPAAFFAIAADFGAGHGDFEFAILFDLLHEFFVEEGFEFADFSAFQAGDVDVVARAVALVEVLVAPKVQQVELIDEAVALEQIKSSVDGDTMHAGIDFLRSFENGAGVQVAFGVVHDLQQDFSLAGEAHATFFQRGLQAAGARVRVDAFAGGDSMCSWGGHSYWCVRHWSAERGANSSRGGTAEKFNFGGHTGRGEFSFGLSGVKTPEENEAFLSCLKARPTNLTSFSTIC